MIQALPEILFYDSTKDVQEYEDERDVIFNINFLKKYFNTKLSRYKDSFYKSALDREFFITFNKEITFINHFVFGEEKEEEEPEVPTYLVDDIEEEVSPEGEEEDTGVDFIDWLKKLWRIRQIYNYIKTAKKILKKFNKIKQILKRGFRQVKRGFRIAKRYIIKMIRRARIFYRKVVKPWAKRAWRYIVKKFKIMRKIVKRAVSRAKRQFLKIARRIIRQLGKQIIRFLRRFSKKLIKRFIQQALKWVAGLFTGTGVGAVIGVALFAAVAAWEIYDLTHDVDTEPHIKPSEVTKTKQNPIEDISEIPEGFMDVNVPIPPKTLLEIQKHYEHVTDKATLTLINARSQPQQIIGRLNYFYNDIHEWLENQQTFVESVIETVTSKANEFFDTLVNLTASKEIKEDEHQIPIPSKDLSKVKTPKFTSWETITLLQNRLEKLSSKTDKMWASLRTGITLNFNEEVTTNNTGNKRDGNIFTRFLPKQLAQTNLLDIVVPTPNIKIFQADKELVRYNDIKSMKRGMLGLKNHLLYELYNRLVWLRECAPSKT